MLGFLTYANGLSSPLVYDDAVTVHDNETIRHLWPLGAALSPPAHDTPVSGRPLVNLSLAINYAAGGLHPHGYHVVNLAAHVACALLLFGIVRRTLTGTRAASPSAFSEAYPTILALSCAVIWLVHPLESEVADYISARTESLMAMFYLLTLYASIRSADARGRSVWTPAALAACAFGMACKESMATAPLMVVLYDRVFRFSSWKRLIGSRWPLYVGLAASWAVLAALIWQGPRAHSAGFSADAGLVTAVSPWVYLLNQAIMIVRYLRLVVWPLGLILDYGVPRPVTLGEAAPYAIAIAVLLAAASAAWIPRLRWGGFAFLGAWFFITLAPASSLVPVYTEAGAERRMYLPMMAVAVAVVMALAHLVDLTPRPAGLPARRSVRDPRRFALPGFVAAIVVMCGALASATVQRNAEYASGLSIWQTVVDRFPHGRARYHLAMELKAAGRQDEAMIQLREAVRDYPDARSILGFTLLDAGRIDEGIDELRAFIRERPSHVNVVVAHGRMGDALLARQRYGEAADEYRQYPDASGGGHRRVDELRHRARGEWTDRRSGARLRAGGSHRAAERRRAPQPRKRPARSRRLRRGRAAGARSAAARAAGRRRARDSRARAGSHTPGTKYERQGRIRSSDFRLETFRRSASGSAAHGNRFGARCRLHFVETGAGLLRPGARLSALLRLARGGAVVQPGAAARSRARDGARRPVDLVHRAERRAGGARCARAREGAGLERSRSPTCRRARAADGCRGCAGRRGEAGRVPIGARRRARRVPAGRGALAATRPGRVSGSRRARAGQQRRVGPLLREGAGDRAGAFRRTSFPHPRVRKHGPRAGSADARRQLCEDGASRAPRAAHARSRAPACGPHRRRDRGVSRGGRARVGLLHGRTDSDRVRLALPAQSGLAGDVLSGTSARCGRPRRC